MRRSKVDLEVELFSLYSRNPSKELARDIQYTLDTKRELKECIAFTSKSNDLGEMSALTEAWCDTHQGALEKLGLPEVVRVVRDKPVAIKAIVLAYWYIAGGPESTGNVRDAVMIAKGLQNGNIPVREVNEKLCQLGYISRKELDVVHGAIAQLEKPKGLPSPRNPIEEVVYNLQCAADAIASQF